MVARQDGRCAICCATEARHIDHDHDTGQVRGMLCFRCNAALGQLDDSPDRLRRAADYLEAGVEQLLAPPSEAASLRRLEVIFGWSSAS